jgi:hypothetical protein
MINVSERFRFKALASEVFARDATDAAIRSAWTEIAIEWHALANRVAQETCSKSSLKLDNSTPRNITTGGAVGSP